MAENSSHPLRGWYLTPIRCKSIIRFAYFIK
jgi:hypothetical protein